MKAPNPQYMRRGVAASSRSMVAKRRSPRVAVKTPIGLSGEDALKCAFTMPSKASNLNRHGATIQSTRQLAIGSTIVLHNKRGSQITARVVAQVSSLDGVRSYGIEFLEPDDPVQSFWGISFPTA